MCCLESISMGHQHCRCHEHMKVKLHLIVNRCIVTIVIKLALTIIFFGSVTGIQKKNSSQYVGSKIK